MNFTKYFTRDNPRNVYCINEQGKLVLQDFIYKIHKDYFFDCLPNDWIFETVYEAFCDLQNYGSDEEDQFERVMYELESDCELYKWLDNNYSDEYCDTALQDYGPFKRFYDIVGFAQVNAKRDIYNSVWEFLKKANEQDEEASDERKGEE